MVSVLFFIMGGKMSAVKIGGSGVDDLVEVPICVAMRGRNPCNPSSRKTGIETVQMIEPADDGKANSFLATSGKGAWANGMSLVRTPIQLNESTESGGKQPYQQNRVYDVNGLAPAVMANLSCGSYAIYENMRIRRITPTECARLQTIPEWYRWECSETQQYRMLGNGWTVEVIKHIFSFIDRKD